MMQIEGTFTGEINPEIMAFLTDALDEQRNFRITTPNGILLTGVGHFDGEQFVTDRIDQAEAVHAVEVFAAVMMAQAGEKL